MATGPAGTERTIGQLVADATHDLEGIVRGEIALARAEVTSGAKVIGKGAGLLGGAAFLALMGVLFLLHSAAWGIAEWLPVWAGYLIVAAVVLLVAVVLGLMGKKALEAARPAPERAIDQAQQTIAVIKNTGSEPDAAATASTPVPAGASTAPGAGGLGDQHHRPRDDRHPDVDHLSSLTRAPTRSRHPAARRLGPHRRHAVTPACRHRSRPAPWPRSPG